MNYMSYIIVSVLAMILGQATKHLCKKLPAWVEEKISFKEFLQSLKHGFKTDIKYTVIYLTLFNLLVYLQGFSYVTILYAICIFSLMLVFSIDYRFELIADESHIIIAIAGVINIFFNLNNWYDYLIGAVIGGGSFYLLGLLALWIYKKEGMGFGDVKLMAALGLFFGIKNILVITILSFALAAVISVILMILRLKKIDSYIPFGPFIVIATIGVMFFGPDKFINVYYTFCMWLGTCITDLIFEMIN